MVYGDNEITAAVTGDMLALAPTLVAELSPPPAGYAGELYWDLRTTAGGYRFLGRDDLADATDAIADAYGRAIHTTFYTKLAGGDGGASDGVLGTPVAGGATAYAPGDVATGALALIDLAAARHATGRADANAAHLAGRRDRRRSRHLDARARRSHERPLLRGAGDERRSRPRRARGGAALRLGLSRGRAPHRRRRRASRWR